MREIGGKWIGVTHVREERGDGVSRGIRVVRDSNFSFGAVWVRVSFCEKEHGLRGFLPRAKSVLFLFLLQGQRNARTRAHVSEILSTRVPDILCVIFSNFLSERIF